MARWPRGLSFDAATAGLLYFALVFGAGFVLGVVRVLWLVPMVGTRAAELIEAPIMLVITIVAARFVVRRRRLPPTASWRLGTGLVGLLLLLAAEVAVVVLLSGVTVAEYVASRDAVAGTVYLVSLVLFAAMPFLVARSA